MLSGGQQAVLIVQKGGLYTKNEKGEQTLREKVKVAITHALANDLALVLYGVKWWIMGSQLGQDYGAGGASGLLSGEKMGIGLGAREVLLGVAAWGVMIAGANLGGKLTYAMGVGMAFGKGKTA